MVSSPWMLLLTRYRFGVRRVIAAFWISAIGPRELQKAALRARTPERFAPLCLADSASSRYYE